MDNRILVWLVLAGTLALVAGCGDRASRKYEELNSSDFGLGIHFGDSPKTVHGYLGRDCIVEDLQNQTNITEFYLPPDITTTDSDTPQLALTYLNGGLERLYNRMYPEDESRAVPPWLIEPLPGVKVGNRKSDFIDALGPPSDPLNEGEWRFKHKDGRQIVVMASFVEMPYVKEQRCNILQVVRVPAVEQLMGEEQKKQADWRKKVGLE
jgi:hypothetical protein